MDIHDKPQLWEQVKKEFYESSKGGKPNTWSARKAQLAVLEYQRRGGKYTGPRSKAAKDLVKWTKEDWTTKSGKPSSETGERYLPRKAIEALSPQQYGATTRAKREGTEEGKQFVAQPKKIAAIVRGFR